MVHKPTPTSADAFAFCERLARTHYENFTVGSRFLPKRLRKHITVLYSYARGVDDLGDEAAGDRLALLETWDRELKACYAGAPVAHPVFVALRETIREFDIPIEPFERLTEANRRDQAVKRYATFADLVDYCVYSANPCGRLVLYLFGYRDPERQALSDATCTALQLANFWQDVRKDWEMGRVYLPQEDMVRFGYTESDLGRGTFNDAFRSLMKFEVARTREWFGRGRPLIASVSRELARDLALFTMGGEKALDAIEKIDCDVLHKKARLSKGDKLALVAKAGLGIFG